MTEPYLLKAWPAMKASPPYQGFECGPIRPPSEADSLCLRITRNCPWNRCTFCPVYKDEKFSLRPVADVIQDIETLFRHTQTLRALTEEDRSVATEAGRSLLSTLAAHEPVSFRAAYRWFCSGMESVFLQDADSLVMKADRLIQILEHLKRRFPQIRRITSYARSHTLARKKASELQALREAGLNRLHIGLESGSDAVLARVRKGATKALHIRAGQQIKAAGIELSEYYMPGLGGQELAREHALESADALNQINPDFIRLRTLMILPQAPLFKESQAGRFNKSTEVGVVEEIVCFLEQLQGITSTLTSDHFLNLFPEVDGRLPEAKERILPTLRRFLNADPERQRWYQVGRRMGLLSRFQQLDESRIAAQIRAACTELGVSAANVDAISYALLLQQGL
jgi:hypothetical protein